MEDKKEYVVYITETLQRKVKVKADSLTDAEEKVQEMYSKEEITLDYNDYLQVEFDARNI
jgi:hypothetical protein